VLVHNVQDLVDRDMEEMARAVPFKAGDDPRDFAIDQYHSEDEINGWFQSLATAYPDLVTVTSVGNSLQGRPIQLIKIGKSTGQPKKIFWLDGGIHAREWVAVSTCLYIVNELVMNYQTNAAYADLINTIDIYIAPSVNPDGYEYSRNTDRMWRKTRSGPRSGCYGVDPNRNWNFKWNFVGTSSNPCSETYDGPSAFSEVETQVLSNFLLANKAQIKAYVSLHSYSELWMFPWSYATHTYTTDHQDYVALSQQAVAAISKKHGTKYQWGTAPDILYAVGGGSFDWAKAVAGIKWAITLELRPGPGDHDNDQNYGFQLP
uniref:Peptidase M14 carboxypeptidase A domain-containing protein n=1 Tax=Plectus sambesii TaxID=2011161 RepID=A0A914V4Z8_9BILA